MENNSNILITSAGRRVSLINSFKKELKSLLPLAMIYATDSQPGMSAGSMVADDFFQVPLVSDLNFITKLLDICKENKIGLLIPTLDPELLLIARNKHLFEKIGTHVLISDLSLIEVFDDKSKSTEFYIKLGIDTPKIYSKERYQFPLYVKPINGSASKSNFIVKNKSELCEHFLADQQLYFFEYISPNEYDEYTCDLYYNKKGDLKCVVPRIRLEVRSGESSKGVTKKNHLISLILEKMGNIPGARGCITAQFFVHKKDKKNIKGIEINGRFGGGYPLSYYAGANFPKWVIEEYLFNKEIEYFDQWEENLLMLRYDSELLIHEFK